VDDSLHRGQTDAGAWKLSRGVKALEGSEKTIRMARVKSSAVITHKK